MMANCFIQNTRGGESPGTGLRRHAAGFLAFVLLMLTATRGFCGEPQGLTEYQVKGLFLLNFAKYVDWPAEVFTNETDPVIIGVIGETKYADDLKNSLAGKTFGKRAVILRQIENVNESPNCHILFITTSEKNRLSEILAKVKGKPILTVGEWEQFVSQGGMVNFMKKQGKVRLEIDLNASRAAGLQISSKLLSVADVVHREKEN